MNIMILRLFQGFLLSGLLLLSSCNRAHYQLERVEGRLISVDSKWDEEPDARYISLLLPYQTAVDSVMNRVIGVSTQTMTGSRPESLLSNLVADVLRDAATSVLGRPADMGMVNMGGLRNILTEGTITCGNIYEILPFENSLCVLTLKGSDLRALFGQIARVGGEGVSGVKLTISADRRLLSATVNNRPVDDDALYTLATIDYLADGNDGMLACLQAQKRECPPEATLRGLFMTYVERQTQAGKKITSRMEGRITVEP